MALDDSAFDDIKPEDGVVDRLRQSNRQQNNTEASTVEQHLIPQQKKRKPVMPWDIINEEPKKTPNEQVEHLADHSELVESIKKKEYSLPKKQSTVLQTLISIGEKLQQDSFEINQANLAKSVGISHGSVRNILGALEKYGYLKRRQRQYGVLIELHKDNCNKIINIKRSRQPRKNKKT